MELEQRVDQIIISKGKFYWILITTIIGACIAVGVPFFSVKMDVALIKSNHYTHIENLQNQVKELKQKDTELQEQNVKLMQSLGAYNSKLDQLLGAHNIKPEGMK